MTFAEDVAEDGEKRSMSPDMVVVEDDEGTPSPTAKKRRKQKKSQ